MTEILLISGPALTLVASVAFAVVYSRVPWYSSRWGQMMMATSWAVALLAASYVLARVDDIYQIGVWPVHGWSRSIAWWAIGFVYAWKIAQVVTATRDDGRDGPH